MADPVSWFLIEPGWKVEDASGRDIGRVREVVGDSNADIFDGLAIASSALSKARYVPAEQVGEIVDGLVKLKLGEHAVDGLGEYDEPPVSETIEPEQASLFRRILSWFGPAGRR